MEFPKDALPIEIANIVMKLMPNEQNAGAEFYRSAAYAGILSIARAYRASGDTLTKYKLIHLLTGAGTLESLLRKIGEVRGFGSREYEEFSFFLNQHRSSRTSDVNMNNIKFLFGGVVGRLAIRAAEVA